MKRFLQFITESYIYHATNKSLDSYRQTGLHKGTYFSSDQPATHLDPFMQKARLNIIRINRRKHSRNLYIDTNRGKNDYRNYKIIPAKDIEALDDKGSWRSIMEKK